MHKKNIYVYEDCIRLIVDASRDVFIANNLWIWFAELEKYHGLHINLIQRGKLSMTIELKLIDTVNTVFSENCRIFWTTILCDEYILNANYY